MIQSCYGCSEDILPGMLHWARKNPPQLWHIHCALEALFAAQNEAVRTFPLKERNDDEF